MGVIRSYGFRVAEEILEVFDALHNVVSRLIGLSFDEPTTPSELRLLGGSCRESVGRRWPSMRPGAVGRRMLDRNLAGSNNMATPISLWAHPPE